ncbi:MAG: pyridoxamine 5'-phosphate oxidase [Deltaproteobacteria bacterium]|nr:pyridoxamine 5'-phosphate oxidase [Deltaproteobacteria bacterium]
MSVNDGNDLSLNSSKGEEGRGGALDLAAIRTDYTRAGLSERDVHPSPLVQAERWLSEAIVAGHPEPTAMTLATVTPSGDPAARVVLLKGLDEGGLVFFTSYDSDKGTHLAGKARACANLFWVLLERQVRFTGSIVKIAREESEAYFAMRPRESRLGAWASRQSSTLAGRAELEARLDEARARFANEPDVPCPPTWGGYRLVPDTVELWQGRPSRLHDRLRYTRIEPAAPRWRIERLSP